MSFETLIGQNAKPTYPIFTGYGPNGTTQAPQPTRQASEFERAMGHNVKPNGQQPFTGIGSSGTSPAPVAQRRDDFGQIISDNTSNTLRHDDYGHVVKSRTPDGAGGQIHNALSSIVGE